MGLVYLRITQFTPCSGTKDLPCQELPLCGHVVSRSFQDRFNCIGKHSYLYWSKWLPSRSKLLLPGQSFPPPNTTTTLTIPDQCCTFDTGTDDAIVQDGISLNRPDFFSTSHPNKKRRPKSCPLELGPKVYWILGTLRFFIPSQSLT